jgi:pyruvate ferredoxin oxidoreductase gamma subunit
VTDRTVVLIHSEESREIWKERLSSAGTVLTLPVGAEAEDTLKVRFVGAMCAGAASRLVGVISRSSLGHAIRDELSECEEKVIEKNLEIVLDSYDQMESHGGCVVPGDVISAVAYPKPDWVDPPFDNARISAPAIFAPVTSGMVRTGLWRTVRPVIDRALCGRCLLCSVYCPEGCISVDGDGCPQIDYDHCKGCLICLAQCPSRAIMSQGEHGGEAKEGLK